MYRRQAFCLPVLTLVVVAQVPAWGHGQDPASAPAQENRTSRAASAQNPFSALAQAAQPPRAAVAQDPYSVSPPGDARPQNRQTKLFTILSGRAVALEKILQKLYKNEITATSDTRSNTLLVKGSERTLIEIEAIILRLEQSKSAEPGLRDPDESRLSRVYESIRLSRTGRLKFSDDLLSHPSQLRDERAAYQQAELKTRQLAQDCRKAGSTAAMKKQLSAAVAAAFAARQSLQEYEVAMLRQRVDLVQQEIRRRSQLKAKIIERRVIQLLEPDELQWDSPSPVVTAENGRLLEVDMTEKAKNARQFLWRVLGLGVRDIQASQLPRGANLRGGLDVVGIRKGSTTDQAGLQLHDVLVGMDKWETTSAANARWILENTEGNRLELVVYREGKRMRVPCVVNRRSVSLGIDAAFGPVQIEIHEHGFVASGDRASVQRVSEMIERKKQSEDGGQPKKKPGRVRVELIDDLGVVAARGTADSVKQFVETIQSAQQQSKANYRVQVEVIPDQDIYIIRGKKEAVKDFTTLLNPGKADKPPASTKKKKKE